MHLNLCKVVNFKSLQSILGVYLIPNMAYRVLLSLFTHSIDKPIISLRYWLEFKSYTSRWGLFMGSVWWMAMGGEFLFWGLLDGEKAG